jgi:demethylmenaquinone methyltransferase/2-methoxy-6-polyprenyl-1,4-benzoquinol methylase
MGTPIKPYYSDASKKTEVATMFNNIAKTYDFLNHFLSFGIDILWRKKAIACLIKDQPQYILDVATGTGDFAFEALSKLHPTKLIGIDISEGMLEVGRKKVKERGFEQIIELRRGDSENLPFEDHSFDAYTVAFGVRNFENLEQGMREMLRVLRPNGVGVVLEFSQPKHFPIKQLFGFYFKFIMPTLGKWVSKDSRAYAYLPESVAQFPSGKDFLSVMEKVGYKRVRCIPLSGGIASIYIGEK